MSKPIDRNKITSVEWIVVPDDDDDARKAGHHQEVLELLQGINIVRIGSKVCIRKSLNDRIDAGEFDFHARDDSK